MTGLTLEEYFDKHLPEYNEAKNPQTVILTALMDDAHPAFDAANLSSLSFEALEQLQVAASGANINDELLSNYQNGDFGEFNHENMVGSLKWLAENRDGPITQSFIENVEGWEDVPAEEFADFITAAVSNIEFGITEVVPANAGMLNYYQNELPPTLTKDNMQGSIDYLVGTPPDVEDRDPVVGRYPDEPLTNIFVKSVEGWDRLSEDEFADLVASAGENIAGSYDAANGLIEKIQEIQEVQIAFNEIKLEIQESGVDAWDNREADIEALPPEMQVELKDVLVEGLRDDLDDVAVDVVLALQNATILNPHAPEAALDMANGALGSAIEDLGDNATLADVLRELIQEKITTYVNGGNISPDQAALMEEAANTISEKPDTGVPGEPLLENPTPEDPTPEDPTGPGVLQTLNM